eukprot:scaffold1619_cov121-Isochrysis_galbana.AAC.5
MHQLVCESVLHLLLAHLLLCAKCHPSLLRVVVTLDVLPQALGRARPAPRALGRVGLAALERGAAGVVDRACRARRQGARRWADASGRRLLR